MKPGGEGYAVSMRDLVTAYGRWRQGRHPKLALEAMADELAALGLDCGLPVDDRGDQLVVRGILLRPARPWITRGQPKSYLTS